MATALLAGVAMAGCQAPGLSKLALQHALQLDSVTAPLPMRILHRQPADDANILRLYLGGDGTPWRNGQPAKNPTLARVPLGLRLFLRDPEAHGYIGRPCYHFTDALPPGCSSSLWTSHRYSENVVNALSEQVQRLAQHYNRQQIELVGFSGGGTLALLISARVPQVRSVVTIAAPLDPHAWTAFHGLLPLSGSLSPLTVSRSSTAEELHLMGARDTVVPPALGRQYQTGFPDAALRIIDDFNHRCCWESYWPDLLQQADRNRRPRPTLTPAPQ